MRPINLIPAEERRRNRGSGARSGPLPFLVVGALALLLVGILMLLHYSNQLSGREDNIAHLEVQKAEATARASELAPFVSFAQVTEQRTSAISELANDRFDWARVIQQLSLILPDDVYFTSLNASAGGGSEGGGVAAPSLTVAGCAPSQDAVAGFVATLKQIDGVTRVSLENSAVSEAEGEQKVSGASPCAIGKKAAFTILVAFDLAPSSPDGTVATESEAAAPEGESETEGSTEGSSTESEGASEPESPESESAPAQSASTGEVGAAG